MVTNPHHFGEASAVLMSPATAVTVVQPANVGILGVSTSANQNNIHFLAAVMALMLKQLPDHLGNVIQAPCQNLIVNYGKQDQPDTFGELMEPDTFGE